MGQSRSLAREAVPSRFLEWEDFSGNVLTLWLIYRENPMHLTWDHPGAPQSLCSRTLSTCLVWEQSPQPRNSRELGMVNYQ